MNIGKINLIRFHVLKNLTNDHQFAATFVKKCGNGHHGLYWNYYNYPCKNVYECCEEWNKRKRKIIDVSNFILPEKLQSTVDIFTEYASKLRFPLFLYIPLKYRKFKAGIAPELIFTDKYTINGILQTPEMMAKSYIEGIDRLNSLICDNIMCYDSQ